MENNVARHIADLPELLRPPVALWFERLSEQNAGLPDEFIAPVVRLVACSEFAARVLLREFSWFIEHIESFAGAPGNELEDFVAAVYRSDADIPEVQAKLRRFRHRYLLRILQERQPANLRVMTLLDKPDRREVDVQVDWVGFSIPNEFVVGYGLDYGEIYRNLPYIGVLKEEVYTTK